MKENCFDPIFGFSMMRDITISQILPILDDIGKLERLAHSISDALLDVSFLSCKKNLPHFSTLLKKS